jgi:SagB-type dehydrogenase family enzyme
MDDGIALGREFLKGGDWDQWAKTATDQRKKIPMPDLQKDAGGLTPIDLPDPALFDGGTRPLAEALRQRRSYRGASSTPIPLEALSFMLWATQGGSGNNAMRRTAPSAGARHPFETYLYVRAVTGLTEGMYRYLPLSHQLVALPTPAECDRLLAQAACNQPFVSGGAVTFIWTAIPYRTEWRYATLSHKVIAIDAGHVCQNLYLAATAADCGACAIGAYNQQEMDQLIGVDGQDEFVVYLASCCPM